MTEQERMIRIRPPKEAMTVCVYYLDAIGCRVEMGPKGMEITEMSGYIGDLELAPLPEKTIRIHHRNLNDQTIRRHFEWAFPYLSEEKKVK